MENPCGECVPSSPSGLAPAIQEYTRFVFREEQVVVMRKDYGNNPDGLIRGESACVMNVAYCLSEGEFIVSDEAARVLNKDERWVARIWHDLAQWGGIDPETAEANFRALRHGGELRSAFHTANGVHLTVVTNAARNRTVLELDRGGRLLASRETPGPGPGMAMR